MVVLLIVLAVVAAILLLRLGLILQYGSEGPRAWAKIGPLRLTLYPRKEKPKKAEKKEKKPEKEPEDKPDRGGPVERLRAGLAVAKPIAEKVRRALTIRELALHYTAATDDAAMTALAYGGAWAAVSGLMPLIVYNFRVKKQDIQIQADFDSGGESRVFVRVHFSLAVWEAVYLALFVMWQIAKGGLAGGGQKKEETGQTATT